MGPPEAEAAKGLTILSTLAFATLDDPLFLATGRPLGDALENKRLAGWAT
jgi:hypothetical protein